MIIIPISMKMGHYIDTQQRVPSFPKSSFGQLQVRANYYHKKWGLLSSPRRLPTRPRKLIDDFIAKCKHDAIYAGTMATLRHTEVANLTLTDREVLGENEEEMSYSIIHNRMPGKFSMVIEPKDGTDILDRLNKMLPNELIPNECDSAESVLQRNNDCLWLDEVWRHGKRRPTNGDKTSKQPVRRTISVAENFPSPISNPCEGEERLFSTRLFVYTCREMPVSKWMVRPATNGELAIVLEIWKVCWGLLREPSRRAPPNAWQYVVYQKILGRKMGLHRDNYSRGSLRDMAKGGSPYNNSQKWSGVKNSQVYGSCVIVYSFGNCPMKMVFSCLSRRGGPYQKKNLYEVKPSFCFQFCQGYVCVLDCIDDILMMHGLSFVGVRVQGNQNRLVRAALVMRRLDNLQEFYAHTSTIRLNNETKRYEASGVAAREPIRRKRSAWT